MKYNIESLKGFPLNNDQKETLLGLIKKMCDENISDESNATKPTQSNEPIQIIVSQSSNSKYEFSIATKFGQTWNTNVSMDEDNRIGLVISDDKLFEYVKKNIQHCTFELFLTEFFENIYYYRTNQFTLQFEIIEDDDELKLESCHVYFYLKPFIDELFIFDIRIEKNN